MQVSRRPAAVRAECSVMQASEKPAHFQNSAERRGGRRADPRSNTVQDDRDIRSGNPKEETTGSETAIEAARMRTLSIASGSGKPAERAKNILGLHALAEIGIDKSSLNDAIALY